jgi:hypothetical protein
MLPSNAKALPRSDQASAEIVAIAQETAQQRRAMARASSCTSEDHRADIADTAYLIALSRGFEPGHELEDWLAAEELVSQRLMGEGRNF